MAIRIRVSLLPLLLALSLPLALAIEASAQAEGAAPAPANGAVPSPRAVLGFEPGAPRQLADWPQIVDYFKRLDAASGRVSVHQAGLSTGRRPFIFALISSEENIRNLPRIREAQAKLADPRLVRSPEERERLIRETPSVVAITCSIHSTEVVAAQMSMELAYRLASDDSGPTSNVLRNTVLVLVPSVNPDGIDIVGNWYRKTLGSKFEGTSPPELYHIYTGHDNNRDWFMLTQVETQMVSKLFWQEWFPQIVYDVHQQGQYGSRMFVPPFFDPANPNIDPVLLRQVGAIGMKMAANLTAEGFKGIATNSTYDMWWHGGLRTAPYYHNSVGILTEAASANLATPLEIKREQLRSSARGLQDPLAPAINFPAPWEGGTWSPRDIFDMELITCRTVLEEAALHREALIRNFVGLAERAIEAGRREAPYAYVVPSAQADRPTSERMIDILMRQGVEVHRAKSDFTADGKTYGAGSYVILLAQPYRANVKCLFEAQTYPDRRLYPGGPAEPPYDVAGWTLPMQMGVSYAAAGARFAADLEKLEPLGARAALPGSSELKAALARPVSSGTLYLRADANNAYLLINELFKSPGTVSIYRLARPATIGAASYKPGDFVIDFNAPKERKLQEIYALAERLSVAEHLGFARGGRANLKSSADFSPLAKPRTALYRSWMASMDEGWTRWVLEQFGFEHTNIFDADVRAGNLRERFDVVILPDQSMQQIVAGNRAGSYPEEYTGGITEAGVANLKAFVEAGGVLVCLDSSSELAINRFGLPVSNALDDLRRDQFYAPGSIFRAALDGSHPLASGMPPEADLYFVSGSRRGPAPEEVQSASPAAPRQPPARREDVLFVSAYAFEITDPARAVSVARYVDGNPLRSGWLLGPEHIAGKSALVDAKLGNGRVILFGFRPQHRAQTWGTFKLLFNSILMGAGGRDSGVRG
ncbi:MAG TPA: M14 family metallopeptidase [Blastocatellia bacterium]|nr:M14 family metallopeptidase [Blastocatellia bacterium]